MKARSVALTALVAALLGACAATPVQEEPQEAQPSLGVRIVMGFTELLVSAAFDAAFSSGERHDKHERRHERSNSWAPSATPTSYAPAPATRTTETKRTPVSLKAKENGVRQ